MKLSPLPIAPLPLPSGPFYRPVTIMLYNPCHCLFTLCEASQGHFGNLAGPVLTHLTDVHFTPCQTTCPLPWQTELRSPSFPARASPAMLSGSYLRLPSRPHQHFTFPCCGLRPIATPQTS
jgi:hypothetical protein